DPASVSLADPLELIGGRKAVDLPAEVFRDPPACEKRLEKLIKARKRPFARERHQVSAEATARARAQGPSRDLQGVVDLLERLRGSRKLASESVQVIERRGFLRDPKSKQLPFPVRVVAIAGVLQELFLKLELFLDHLPRLHREGPAALEDIRDGLPYPG